VILICAPCLGESIRLVFCSNKHSIAIAKRDHVLESISRSNRCSTSAKLVGYQFKRRQLNRWFKKKLELERNRGRFCGQEKATAEFYYQLNTLLSREYSLN